MFGMAKELETYIITVVDGGYRDDLSDGGLLHYATRNIDFDVYTTLRDELGDTFITYHFSDGSEIEFHSAP